MHRRRTATSIVAIATGVGLLLSGCGSDDGGGKDDKIAGAEGGKKADKKSASPTEPSTDEDAPKMPLPKDLKLVFDWKAPADADEAAALQAASGFIRSITYGIVQQDPESSAYKFYGMPAIPGVSDGGAQTYAKQQIKLRADAKDTQTGTDYYSRPEVEMKGKQALVSFCNSTEKLYSKDVKTGKVTKTEPSLEDFYFFRINMEEVEKDSWKVRSVGVDEKAGKCRS